MAETSHEIRRQIEDTRARIGGTIAALEHKIDPHRIVDEHPLTIVGVAFGTGLLLSTTGATGRAARGVKAQVREGALKVNSTAGTAIDGIVDAIVGAATATITAKMNELLHVMFDSPTKPKGRSVKVTRAA